MFKSENSHSAPSSHHQIPSNGQIFYLDDVWVNFGKLTALRSIHLTINQEEMIFVTGPSGAGKSTLLRVLGGLERPTRGRMIHPDVEGGHRSFSTMVFQDLKLLEFMTAEENLWFAYDPRVFQSRDDFLKDMMEYSKYFGIKDKLHLPLKTANGGLKQKIGIVRALLGRPKVLLADEPTSALDKENAIKLYEILNYLNHKRELTVVWASHNRELLKQFSGRIIHLEAGKLIFTGHSCFI